MRPRLVLASASPRRAFLLERAGILFDVVRPDEVELGFERLHDPIEMARKTAQAKARSVASRLPGRVVLGCDTVVAVDEHVLGKPNSTDDARRMLSLLSDRWHRVITGLCLIGSSGSDELVEHEESEVEFVPLQSQDIEAYLASGEPFDKAGGYAVQGGASSLVIGLRGPLDNVIGLPVRLVRRMLLTMGIEIAQA